MAKSKERSRGRLNRASFGATAITEELSPQEIVLLTVAASDEGKRLDQYLASQLPDYSRTRLHKQITEGDVLVNDLTAKAAYRLHAGDAIEVELPVPIVAELVAEPIPLDIVYEDEDLIVINKPAGLVVHPGAGINRGTLANGLAAHFGASASGLSPLRPGIVHRLDRDTSGLLVVAKNEIAHQRLTDQFAARTVEKRYAALVYGRMEKAEGVVDLPIGRHPVHRVKMCIAKPGRGRSAFTRWSAQSRFDEFTLLDVEIKTGRTHQIRVHLAHLHHPVVGDGIYGSGFDVNIRSTEVRRAVNRLDRHLLHAAKLAFDHPMKGIRMEFASDLPKKFVELLSMISIDTK